VNFLTSIDIPDSQLKNDRQVQYEPAGFQMILENEENSLAFG
jgi:hypothetical protein